MTIKQYGGVFGRNPTFNDVTIEGQLTFDGDIDINSDLKIDGDLEVSGDVDITSTAANPLALVSTNASGAYATFNNGVQTSLFAGFGSTLMTGATTSDAVLRYDSNDNLYIARGSAKVATFNNTGSLEIANGNVIMGTSGSGIDFSATAGTGTSELLDDYEEGTWTSLVGGTATYGANSGRYTKIGRQVFATFDLNITTIGTGSTSVITGLPFPVGDAIAEGVSVNFYSGLANNVVELNAYVIDSEIRFRAMSSAGSGLTEIAVLGSGCRVTGTAIYTV
jgi:hypothetical protein